MGAPRLRPELTELPTEPKRGRTVADRFWEKCDRSGGPDACWPWMGSSRWDFYGEIWIETGKEMAHRVAWMLTYGPIPSGVVVDHKCRVHSCQNPKHMQLTTQSENCCDLAPGSVSWRNKDKTVCKHGHPLSGENLAITPGTTRKDGWRNSQRVCLTCQPGRWRFAVIERTRPGSPLKWEGPFTPGFPC